MNTEDIIKTIDERLNALQAEFEGVDQEISNLAVRKEQIRGEYTSLLNLKNKILGQEQKEVVEAKNESEEVNSEKINSTVPEPVPEVITPAQKVATDEEAKDESKKVQLSDEEAKKIEEIKKLQEQTPDYLQ